MNRLAVYGTLMRGFRANQNFLNKAKFVEEVQIPGYDMYNRWGFPCIVPNPENKEGIRAEVFEDIDDDTMKNLDYYEAFRPDNPDRSMYLRKEIEVGGKPAFIYVWNPPVGDMPKVESGNFRDVRNVDIPTLVK